ncbi:cobalt-precorrin 5A hydrolase [Acidaminobacter sp. JC074]|uniref:cobalt-precorrin 5A hydrolase n=1 Tax=Acidaminobacter sp. JC074 TaxID=2530199 RepID=UPI001F0E5B68|nr:cobalt-precorrin 5A hydrolase [Acidaminobacter sp. JC074]MCH4888264.1 cobalt-precorrin 5A hydrolase [Acidaminobacter sp. JC074]
MLMLAVISLTKGGLEQAEKLKALKACHVFHKPKPFKEEVLRIYRDYDQILFIMATGIVVRTLGPVLGHKSSDPAVLVMDEKGKHVISLLSGHLGGANALTHEIAGLLNSVPVITTSSDTNNLLSVDMLAEKNGWLLRDFEGAKKVTALLVDGHKIHTHNFKVDEKAYDDQNGDGLVYLGHKDMTFDKPNVRLIPKNLVLGIGCRKNTPYHILEAFIMVVLREHGFEKEAVSKITSAWVKKDENCLNVLSEAWQIDFETYDKDQLLSVETLFESSEFVKETIGVGCVSEPSGYLGSDKGSCLLHKIKKQGMTLSIWENTKCYTL